jgi:L-ascorbate metabolism protein UlaG (beta-lactamase superfamily)
MKTTFQYLGHSCFMLNTNGHKVLFDPFISGNPLAEAQKIDIKSIMPNFILISHGHADHILDAVTIAQQSGATCICSWEIHEWLQKQGVTNTHPMNTGGFWNFGFGKVQAVVAQHSSGLPDGTYGGNPMGFILSLADLTLYYSGDTALTLDMQLIPKRHKIDVAVLPIGSNFTMDIDDALTAAQFVQTKKVIAVHYDTFGFIVVDKEECVMKAKKAGTELIFVNIGETIELR